MNVSCIHKQGSRRTFACSGENPTGSKGGGSRGTSLDKLNAYYELKPGETMTLADLDGPGMIQHIWIGGSVSQSLILRFYWENSDFPSIEVPESSFFGLRYADSCLENDKHFPTLNSAKIMVAPYRGCNCYWEMPFRNHCLITLENRGTDVKYIYYTITGFLGEIHEDSGYFHASYRQECPLAPSGEYVLVDGIRGRGQYVGTLLYVGTNGANGCWVEGETKMFVDGDEYPSINYTGTEDYFCGSYNFGYDSEMKHWQTYSGLYAGMYGALGNMEGNYTYQPRFMLYRLHIPDSIIFDYDLKITLQHIQFTPYGNQYTRHDYSSVAFWYQSEPASTGKPLPSPAETDFR